ncbi:MAG: C40 family peptidase, partial [Actinomycetota bacterium]|nr:C40 family peptidase [Actinomycetota bacterium]
MGTALGQVGKPYAFGTDGPGSFSCTGLVRFALRSIGIMDAPWDHHAYLSAYPTVASPEPGDVVVYPDGAAMYIGNGEVVMANHADGAVGTYPMGAVGTPIGFARPTGGGPTDPAAGGDKAASDTATQDNLMGMDPAGEPAPTTMGDSALLTDPAVADLGIGEQQVPVEQQVPIEQQQVPIEQQQVPI